MVLKVFIEGWICQISFKAIFGEFGWKLRLYDLNIPAGRFPPLVFILHPPISRGRFVSGIQLMLNTSWNQNFNQFLDRSMIWLGLKTIKELFVLEKAGRNLGMSSWLILVHQMVTSPVNQDQWTRVISVLQGLFELLLEARTIVWLFMKDLRSNLKGPKRYAFFKTLKYNYAIGRFASLCLPYLP